MNLALDPAFTAGVLLSVLRVASFVIASPVFPRSIPMLGRLAVSLALGLFLAEPLGGELELPRLVGAALVNVGVGVTLGFLTSLIFAMFPVAGAIIDVTSGLSASATFDPSQGSSAASFDRLFNLTALTLFMVVGGDRLMVEGLALSTQAIPVDGSIQLNDAVVPYVVDVSRMLLVAGAELALPAVAALFLSEVVLGLASRFAPASNVFILGMPLKILLTFTTASLSLALFPGAIDAAMASVARAFEAGLRGLGAG